MPRKPGTSRAKHTLTMMPHTLPGTGGDGPQPITLTGERAQVFDTIRSQYVLEAASESLLRNACEALERAAQLAEQVNRDGATYRDRFNQVRANPAVQLERDFRGLASRTLQQLAARLEG
jgi:hypothetical protein